MAMASLNLGVFTPVELTALMVAAKAEYMRALSGRVVTGSSAAQSYGLTTMTVAELVALLNSLGEQLGIGDFETRVQPNFNARGSFADPTLGW